MSDEPSATDRLVRTLETLNVWLKQYDLFDDYPTETSLLFYDLGVLGGMAQETERERIGEN